MFKKDSGRAALNMKKIKVKTNLNKLSQEEINLDEADKGIERLRKEQDGL